MLDVKSANKGMLIPRVALTGTNDVTTIPSAATSLLVYNPATVRGAQAVSNGYYYWTSSTWLQLAVTKEYAYIYNSGFRVVSPLSLVFFNTKGNMTSGISHPVGYSITLNTPGVYKMEFSESSDQAN